MESSPEFNLEVTVTGLCLLLPRDETKKLHVLMAKPGHGMPHEPLLHYDENLPPVELHGMRLDLTGCKGTKGTLTIPDIRQIPEIADVDQILSDALDAGAYTPLPKDPEKAEIPHLAAHVVLPPGKKQPFSPPDTGGPVGPWATNKGKKLTTDLRLAWYFVWEVRGIPIPKPGYELPWTWGRLSKSGAEASKKLPQIRPEPGGWVKLVVSNLPPGEYAGSRPPAGKDPGKGHPMQHFRGFYGLYGLDPVDPNLPDLIFKGGKVLAAVGTAYNCATSGGH